MSSKPRIYVELLVTVGLLAIPSTIGSIGFLLSPGPDPSPSAATWGLVATIVQELLLLGMVWHVLRLNGESWSTLSKPAERRDAWLAIGLTIGAYAAYILAILVWALVVRSEQKTPASPFAGLQKSSFVPVVLFVLVNPFCEELIVRGFLQHRLSQAAWPGVLIVVFSAALQASYHLYQGITPTIGYLGMFLLFAAFYQGTRRLWPVVAAHALIDWYGVASLLSADKP